MKKEKREGKTIPAVDFMDLNKTMINFTTSTRQHDGSVASKLDTSVADGETKDVSHGGTLSGISQPKLKQMAAFRHTEYAKGFYKVSGATGFDGTTISHRSSAGDANTAIFSEVERTNVLENQSREPLTKKIFGRAGGRGGKSIPSGHRHTIMPALTVDTNTSRFNSTTDSFYPRKS